MTFAELLMGLGIFSLVLLLLLGLFISNAATQIQGQGLVRATHVAETEVQLLKALPYSQLEAFVSSPPPDTTMTVDGTDYMRRIVVDRLSSDATNPDFRMLRVAVVLNWVERRSLSISKDEASLKAVDANVTVLSVVGPEANL